MRIKKAGNFTASDVYVKELLTNLSVAYKLNFKDLVAPQMFPGLSVEKQQGYISKFSKNDWLRRETPLVRAPATESSGRTWAIDNTDTYNCEVHAFHSDIPREQEANSSLGNLRIQLAEYVMNVLLRDREADFVSNYFVVDKWADQGTPNDATGHASNSTWPYFIYFSDGADSDPLAVIRTGCQKIQSSTGFRPNTLLVGREVHDILALHPDIKEVIKYTQTGVADLKGNQLMAQLFGLNKYIVGENAYATNNEGATAAYGYVFGKNMLLTYIPDSVGLLTPASGVTFEWSGLEGLGYDVSMNSWYMQNIKATRVEGEMAYDANLVGSELGVFFSGAVA